MYEAYLGCKMPGELKLVFVPNVAEQHGSKLAIKHAGLLVLDERLLLNHNVIEYRYKIYEIIAEAVAFKFIGGMPVRERRV